MVIRVLNICDGSVLCYSLPLVKGEIKPACSCTTLAVKNVTSGLAHKWPINRGRVFKAFVELVSGDNRIHLACLHNQVTLSLSYHPPVRSRRIRLIYIVCRGEDGSFQAPANTPNDKESAKRRICLGARLLQSFTAEKLWEHDLPRRTFQYVTDEDDDVICSDHVTELTLTEALAMSGEDLWVHFAKELACSFASDLPNVKWLAFMSFTRYHLPNGSIPQCNREVMNCTRGHCALGGGGLGLFGSGSLHTWAETLDDFVYHMTSCQKIDRTQLMDDSAFRGFYWSNYATGLGSVLHEVGHTLDLTHTDDGVMSRGGDDLNLALALPPHGSVCVQCGQEGEQKNFVPPPATNRHLQLVQIETGFAPTRVFSVRQGVVKATAHVTPGQSVCTTDSQGDSSSIKNGITRQVVDEWPKFGDCCSVFHDGRAKWARSSALLLAHHRWLLDDHECAPLDVDSSVLRITRAVLISKYGVRVVEFRTAKGNQVLTHWEYLGGPGDTDRPPTLIPMGTSVLRHALPEGHDCVVMVVEDTRGALYKARIHVNQLGESPASSPC